MTVSKKVRNNYTKIILTSNERRSLISMEQMAGDVEYTYCITAEG